jgi:hypothetical protein
MTPQGQVTFTVTMGQPTLAGPFVYFPLYILVAEERITTKNLLTVLLFVTFGGRAVAAGITMPGQYRTQSYYEATKRGTMSIRIGSKTRSKINNMKGNTRIRGAGARSDIADSPPSRAWGHLLLQSVEQPQEIWRDT